MSTAAEKANLARIRDNQRRSRARRKEYLQELENSLRQCELQGVEASAEIQTAARKVADENKKLRAMLAHNGIDSDSIELFLTTTPIASGMDCNQHGSITGNSVQALEQSLNMRRKCCTNMSISTTEANIARHKRGESSSSATRSPWNTTTRPESVPQSTNPIIPSERSRSVARPSTADCTGNPEDTSQPNLPRSQPRTAPYVQQVPRNLVANMMPSPSNTQTPDLSPQHFPPTPSYSNFPVISSGENYLQMQSGRQETSIYVPAMNNNLNLNNCSYAADMITVMAGAGADSASVRADLGCLPGMDCDVDNQIVFEVMDRYSGHS
ncbi:hypothetical protein GLAREA_08185 [Glarea lozoyensis ATCC 20868]|uniref:BZIP domain-containing protein n=1 Tax=Glarea lozoyensis (strain ATCC 20868 / MF5171) TaxID=1116229 RepID=S3DCE8_GLAL2|nr:uncharacterized protein GLAREA_08185 [Glarea lozoyensis ATCC 20868]EPE24333.1 hypothetical protein GLAREA_08185 [Glarea lozoyensis ATCC 20868]